MCIRDSSWSITIEPFFIWIKSFLIILCRSLPTRTYSGLEHWWNKTFTLFTSDLTSTSCFEVRTVWSAAGYQFGIVGYGKLRGFLVEVSRWTDYLTCVKISYLVINNDLWLVNCCHFRVLSVLFGKTDAFLASSSWVWDYQNSVPNCKPTGL